MSDWVLVIDAYPWFCEAVGLRMSKANFYRLMGQWERAGLVRVRRVTKRKTQVQMADIEALAAARARGA